LGGAVRAPLQHFWSSEVWGTWWPINVAKPLNLAAWKFSVKNVIFVLAVLARYARLFYPLHHSSQLITKTFCRIVK
jgi:hypothetical protein